MVSIGEICAEVHNYFVDGTGDIHGEEFTIADGVITPSDFLLPGQYFRIEGSRLNDNVYKYTGEAISTLKNESFIGYIWAMRVPADFESTVERISAWDDKYGAIGSANMSPYQSESYAGQYSYTKVVSKSEQSTSIDWRSQFSGELDRWRKVHDR